MFVPRVLSVWICVRPTRLKRRPIWRRARARSRVSKYTDGRVRVNARPTESSRDLRFGESREQRGAPFGSSPALVVTAHDIGHSFQEGYLPAILDMAGDQSDQVDATGYLGPRVVELGGAGGEPYGSLDLVGLFVGSEGCFGIATEIEVRLLPVTEGVRTLLGGQQVTSRDVAGRYAWKKYKAAARGAACDHPAH